MAQSGGSPWQRENGGAAARGQELGYPARQAVPCPWSADGPAKQKGTWLEWAIGGGTVKMEDTREAAALTGEMLH
jgi:hypothetical protein